MKQRLTKEIIYRKFGLRVKQDFVSPRVGSMVRFMAPKGVNIHYHNYTDSVGLDSARLTNDQTDTKLNLVSVLTPSSSIGTISSPKGLPLTMYKQLRADMSTFRHYEMDALIGNRVPVLASLPTIINYNILDDSMRYKIPKQETYYRWLNINNTLFTNINELETVNHDRGNYYLIRLPDVLPSRLLLDRHADGTRPDDWKRFGSAEELNVLDMWRWVSKSTRSLSTVGSLSDQALTNTVIVLYYEDNYTLVNLKTLDGFIRTPDNKSGVTAARLRKQFLSLCAFLIDTDREVITDSDVPVVSDSLDKMVDTRVKELDTVSSIRSKVVVKVPHDKVVAVEDKLRSDIDGLVKSGVMKPATYKSLTTIIDQQATRKSPYSSNTLNQDRAIDKQAMSITEQDTVIADIPIVQDKRMLRSSTGVMDKRYINEVYKKDVLNTIYSIQNSGVVIERHDVEVTRDITDHKETHTLRVKPLTGKPSTIRFILPVVSEEGTFQIQGTTNRMQKQRADYPIRKIAPNRVVLTSYYGKIFLTRSEYGSNDPGKWLARELVGIAGEPDSKVSKLTLTNVYMRVPTPRLYGILSRHIRSYKVGGVNYSFDYRGIEDTFSSEVIKRFKTTSNRILVGIDKQNHPVTMDDLGNLTRQVPGKPVDMGDIYSQLGIDRYSSPMEFTTVTVLANKVPLGIVLAYYMGLTDVLKALKATYRIVDRQVKPLPHEWSLTFSDGRVIMSRNEINNNLVLAGLNVYSKEFNKISITNIDQPDIYVKLMINKTGRKLVTSRLPQELDLYLQMFIDPITRELLQDIKEPELFKPLLIRASELLMEDYYHDPQDSEFMLTKGYERIAGALYRNLVKSMRRFHQRNIYGNNKVELNPFDTWNDIGGDPSVILEDNVNPIGQLKNQENLTYTGMGGRSSETMSVGTRVYHESDAGIVSEGVKDSGDVAISFQMSANPKIKNLRGQRGPYDLNKDGPASILSPSALLSPGVEYEDPKRANFTSIQNTHTVPVSGSIQPYLRTGYDYVLPYRVSDRFAYIAEEDGVVKSRTRKVITIQYKDRVVRKRIDTRYSKIEAEVSYPSNITTHLNKGDKVTKGSVVYYNTDFFEIDFMDETRIIYKQGINVLTALLENNQTYEDATALSSKVTKQLASTISKVKTFTVKFDQDIHDMVPIDTAVEPTDPLFVLEDTVGDSTLSSKDISRLKKLTGSAPKAKYKGTVTKIDVKYKGDIEEMSKSLMTLCTQANKDTKTLTGESIPNRVGPNYSLHGRVIPENSVIITYYITMDQSASVGDKGVLSNQLKTTIAEVMPYEVTTEPGEQVGCVFGYRAMQARVVLSPEIIGTTNRLLDHIGKQAVKLFNLN